MFLFASQILFAGMNSFKFAEFYIRIQFLDVGEKNYGELCSKEK